MNDVRYLCERALSDPRPPMTDAADVLIRVRRSVARRAGLTAAAGLVGVTAVTAAVTLGGPALATRAPGGAPAAEQAAAPAPSMSYDPSVHWPDSVDNTEQMDRILLAAVPSGYSGTVTTKRPLPAPDPISLLHLGPNPDPVMIGAGKLSRVQVSAGGAAGELWSVTYIDGRPAPTGDLCVARPRVGIETSCTTVVSNGVSVRVSEEFDTERQHVIVAARYTEGRTAVVVAQQGVGTRTPDGSPAALPQPFMAADQLAALVAKA